MTRTNPTELSDRVQVGDIILPFQGKDTEGRPYSSSGLGGIKVPRNRNVEYVVERAEMEGGGTGHGPHDIYPDGWHVTARRLSQAGTYDPRGKEVRFYQSGCFIDTILQVPVVGKMRRTFVREDAR